MTRRRRCGHPGDITRIILLVVVVIFGIRDIVVASNTIIADASITAVGVRSTTEIIFAEFFGTQKIVFLEVLHLHI